MIPRGAWWAFLIAGGFGAFLAISYAAIGMAHLRRRRRTRRAGR